MVRVLPTSLALLVAAAVPVSAHAQSSTPTPARGKAELVTTAKGIRTASFLAGL